MNEKTEIDIAPEDSLADEDEVLQAAQKAFGIKYLFTWQRLVIQNILDSAEYSRQIVILPTGAGKSMCFLTPALLLPGKTLIIYPLLALMADQERRMKAGNLGCVIFKGGQSDEERQEYFRRLHLADGEKDSAKVIIANPEVLQNKSLLKKIKECGISQIAIDEAHCVCEWGDSFRPAYLTLGQIIKDLECKTVTAFTATASPVVLRRIAEVLFDGQAHLIQSSGDRSNIHYEVHHAYAKEKAALKVSTRFKKPMIVFCGTRKRTENMARLLQAYYGKEKARFYHAGLEKSEKQKIEQWFFDSTDGILAATCAYGMGVDKGDIYTVIHLDAPEHLENFIQEAGRAGRKGDSVNSILIWNHADEIRWRQAKEGSREKALGNFVHTKDCRRTFMLKYLNDPQSEETACSGCDICDARLAGKKLTDKAEDAQKVLDFIKKGRRLYTREEAVKEILEIFNEDDCPEFGQYIWESKDISEIISQLLSEQKLKVCGGLWENRLDIQKTGEKFSLQQILPRRHLHRLHLLRGRLRALVQRLS